MEIKYKILLSFFFVLYFYNSYGQFNLGREWFIGIGNYKVTFENDTTHVFYLNTLDTNSSIGVGNANICDTNGHLILATDGIKVYDSNGHLIDGGGENITNDSLTYYYGFDYPVSNGSIILPKGKHQYYIFTSTMSDQKWGEVFHNNDTFAFDELRYSVVDMQENNGKGKIIQKNKLLLHVDEYPWLNMTNLTACRHANGRDWWVLKPSARMRQVLYKFLVQPDTIVMYKENRPLLFNTWAVDVVGQSCFSKDGSLYTECNDGGPHIIYQFDRCSGDLTLKRVIDIYPFLDTNFVKGKSTRWQGVCFSPNNRFLYTGDYYNIYQIDLEQPNDSLAVKRVSKDTITDIPPLGFAGYNGMQLTPTDIIYIGHWNGTSPDINGIIYPDKLGDSCGFKFAYSRVRTHAYLYFNNTLDPPNMPFYGLGKLSASPCDTIKPPVTQPLYTSIKIYPNPVHDDLKIELPDNSKKYELVVFNLLGEVVLRKKAEQVLQHKISCSLEHLSTGLYSIKIITDQDRYIGKFVKE